MKTVVLDPLPTEVTQLIAQRRLLGLDRYDELWEGVYHMVPAPGVPHALVEPELLRVLRPFADAAGLRASGPFNLGEAGDFRVPDIGYHRDPDPQLVFLPSAEVVVEILSPGDESYDKLPFYAARGVVEVLIVDPSVRRLTCLRLESGRYGEIERSGVLGALTAELVASIRWP